MMNPKAIRIFFAAGPGNVIEAHKNWLNGRDDPSQMSMTFSGEFASACRDLDATALIVSSASPPKFYTDEQFTIEHRPKPIAQGLKYHAIEVYYGLSLLRTAIKFKSDYAVIQSGSTHYFVMSLFRLFGIKVIPVMHNTLWPACYLPKSFFPRTLLFLNSLFFRWIATATLGVSPECIRQVRKVTGGRHGGLFQFNVQYIRSRFEPHTEPPPFDQLRLVYAGRITRNKGVFDLLQIMKRVEAESPGRVSLVICGIGPDLEPLKNECVKLGLEGIVSIRGWTAPVDLRKLLIDSHVSIVPTRSDFAEGMAMTAVEAILVGRPVITNAVVPALEVLRTACMEAETDDTASYATTVLRLLNDPELYKRLVNACNALQSMFYDQSKSSRALLENVIRPNR